MRGIQNNFQFILGDYYDLVIPFKANTAPRHFRNSLNLDVNLTQGHSFCNEQKAYIRLVEILQIQI